MNAKPTINEVLDLPESELKKLTPEQLDWLNYGAKRFDFGAAGIKWTAARAAVLDWIRAHKPPPAPRPSRPTPVSPAILCDCGHRDPHPMTTARGTSCASCYDQMQGGQ